MPLTSHLTFHHLGVACESIAADADDWSKLGYRPEGAPFNDEAQGIRGIFMVGGGPRIELLEASGGSSTLAPWIRRGVKLYHMGYFVPSFDAAIKDLLAAGATLARSPTMSVYFKSRIAFLMLPNMVFIELIDAQEDRLASDLKVIS